MVRTAICAVLDGKRDKLPTLWPVFASTATQHGVCDITSFEYEYEPFHPNRNRTYPITTFQIPSEPRQAHLMAQLREHGVPVVNHNNING